VVSICTTRVTPSAFGFSHLAWVAIGAGALASSAQAAPAAADIESAMANVKAVRIFLFSLPLKSGDCGWFVIFIPTLTFRVNAFAKMPELYGFIARKMVNASGVRGSQASRVAAASDRSYVGR
jgi:hypothetical protein